MAQYTPLLRQLAQEAFDAPEWSQLQALLASPFNLDDLKRFDSSLGGPSIGRLTCRNTGRYDVHDREFLRPLQYCGMYLKMASEPDAAEWLTRDIVQMSGLHLESLLKRVGRVGSRGPLGTVLRKPAVARKLTSALYSQIDGFCDAYNAAKHETDQPKDTHLFSLEDAVLTYLVSRKIGTALYPQAALKTNPTVWESDCP